MKCQPWHDSVEVNYADALACDIIEHDVIELRVVVRDPFRQIGFKQHARQRLVLQAKLYLWPSELYSTCSVRSG